jgi:hypothetical protein
MRIRESDVRLAIRRILGEMALGQYVSNVPTETAEERNLYPSKEGDKARVRKQVEKFPLKVNVIFDLYSSETMSSRGRSTKIGIMDYTPGADQGDRIVVPGTRTDDLVSIDSDAGRAFSDHLYSETGVRPGPDEFNILRLGSMTDFSVKYGPNSSVYMVFHELFDSGPFFRYSLMLQNALYRYLKAIASSLGEDLSKAEEGRNRRGRSAISLLEDLIEMTETGQDDPTITLLSEELGKKHPWTYDVVKRRLMGPSVSTIRMNKVNAGDLREACNEALTVSLIKQVDTVSDYNPAQDFAVQSVLDDMHGIMSEVPDLSANLAGKLYVAGAPG